MQSKTVDKPGDRKNGCAGNPRVAGGIGSFERARVDVYCHFDGVRSGVLGHERPGIPALRRGRVFLDFRVHPVLDEGET